MWRVVACWVLAIAVAGCGDGDGVDQPGVSVQFGECQVTDHEIGDGTTIEFEVPVTNGSGEQDFELWVDVYFRDEYYAGWGTVQSDVPAGLSFVVTDEIDFEEEIDGSLSDWSCEVVPSWSSRASWPDAPEPVCPLPVIAPPSWPLRVRRVERSGPGCRAPPGTSWPRNHQRHSRHLLPRNSGNAARRRRSDRRNSQRPGVTIP